MSNFLYIFSYYIIGLTNRLLLEHLNEKSIDAKNEHVTTFQRFVYEFLGVKRDNLKRTTVDELINSLKKFQKKLKEYWVARNRNINNLEHRYSSWLDSKLPSDKLEIKIKQEITSTAIGRSLSDAAEITDRAIRYRASKISENSSSQEIVLTLKSKLHSKQKCSSAQVVRSAYYGSPERVQKMKDAAALEDIPEAMTFSRNEALALILDTDMSRRTYENF